MKSIPNLAHGMAVTVRAAACIIMLVAPVASIIVISPGACPAVTGMAGFDVSKYKGTWHEYKRFPAFFEIGLECTTAKYTSGDGGVVSVNNQGLLRVPFFGSKLVVSTSSVTGRAIVPNSQRSSELIALFGDAQGGDPGCTPNYIIQDTDYDSYSVVFSCVEALGFNIQFAWILTRCAGVAPENLTELETNLAAAGVDVSKFEIANQEDCPRE